MTQTTSLTINQIIHLVLVDDWAGMLKLFPEGIVIHKFGSYIPYTAPEDFKFVNEKDWKHGIGKTPSRNWCERYNFTHRLPRQQLLKAKCLQYVQERTEGREILTDHKISCLYDKRNVYNMGKNEQKNAKF